MINLIKKLLCKIGWHGPLEKFPRKFDVYDINGNYIQGRKCKWCGFIGQINSQGNLF